MTIFRSIARWGVTNNTDENLAKRIILSNILAMIFTVNMTISMMIFWVFGLKRLAAFTSFFVLTEMLWPWLNKQGKHDLARLGIIITSNVLGFLVSVNLPNTGYSIGFMIMAVVPIMLFELEDTLYIFSCLAFSIFLFILTEFTPPVFIPNESLLLTADFLRLIEVTYCIFYILINFLVVYFMARENTRAFKNLDEQRERAFSSAKFASLGEMASGIGHEINNPLTILNLNLERLKLEVADGASCEDVNIRVAFIQKGIGRIRSIIDAMKSFSRNSISDDMTPAYLKELLEDTLLLCNERISSSNIQIHYKFSNDLLFMCHPSQMVQVFLNLISNSVDAIENTQSRWINVNYEVLDQIIISVTDNGPGIEPKLRDKIFEPFFTTKPVGKGTGLGLSLSRRIIESHGGELFLDSTNSSTSFVIKLPLSLTMISEV